MRAASAAAARPRGRPRCRLRSAQRLAAAPPASDAAHRVHAARRRCKCRRAARPRARAPCRFARKTALQVALRATSVPRNAGLHVYAASRRVAVILLEERRPIRAKTRRNRPRGEHAKSPFAKGGRGILKGADTGCPLPRNPPVLHARPLYERGSLGAYVSAYGATAPAPFCTTSRDGSCTYTRPPGRSHLEGCRPRRPCRGQSDE